MKPTMRLAAYPLLFAGGWLFNFVVDIRFLSGFVAGWVANSALGPYLEALLELLS